MNKRRHWYRWIKHNIMWRKWPRCKSCCARHVRHYDPENPLRLDPYSKHGGAMAIYCPSCTAATLYDWPSQ